MLCITKGVPSCVSDTQGSRSFTYEKHSFCLRARERRISDQNGAGEPHDYESTLYNDTSLKEMGLKKLVEHQCGIPGTGTKYFFIKEFEISF